jgi:hypothetical protein
MSSMPATVAKWSAVGALSAWAALAAASALKATPDSGSSVQGVAAVGDRPSLPAASSGGDDCAERVQGLKKELADRRQKLKVLEFEGKLAVAEKQGREGVVQEWPESVEARFTPEGAEAHLQAAIAEAGMGKLHQMLCDEFPCLAVVDMRDVPRGQLPEEHLAFFSEREAELLRKQGVFKLGSDQPFFDALDQRFGEDTVWAGSQGRVVVVALAPPDLPEETEFRLSHRLNEEGMRFASDLKTFPLGDF